MKTEIVVGDKRYWCVVPVITWHEHGMEFRVGEGYNKKRVQPITCAVWHWTGGEGDPKQLYEILKANKLGVEFAIDKNGTIWQFCDPLQVDTADANFMNARSVGIEIINYGFSTSIVKAGSDRKKYTCTMNGHLRTFAHFNEYQIASAIALANALSSALPIPRLVPLAKDGSVLRRTMMRQELADFCGHLGHFHIKAEKSDPGLDLLEALRICWADRV